MQLLILITPLLLLAPTIQAAIYLKNPAIKPQCSPGPDDRLTDIKTVDKWSKELKKRGGWCCAGQKWKKCNRIVAGNPRREDLATLCIMPSSPIEETCAPCTKVADLMVQLMKVCVYKGDVAGDGGFLEEGKMKVQLLLFEPIIFNPPFPGSPMDD
ncbi:hypothetical protein FPQ18DRAFT_304072 [Pyronema domesticum]|uniref:Uncharacterized protein n=1 Tax=Pyronema omphalodes (strain CBS 100304) TaxID=1076935 RepID=U4L602_PYROM|nr:hypothetical protein FPQ18DRAFT_304072 [Pyronema domesticum]CCX11737.1 Protein of unknown function [Pyronema omphalodes CBS 100304]